MSRRDVVILAAIVVAGTLLRLPLLGEGIWRDEASTYYDVSAHGIGATIAMVVRIELAPPAYFLIEKAWTALFGFGPLALKLPSLFYGVALLVAVYWLGRSVASPAAGLLAAAFGCVSLPAIDLSAQARVYSFAGLAAALTFVAYVQALRSARPAKALVWFALLGTLLAYSNYSASILLALLAMATVYVALRRREPVRLRGFALAFAAIGVAYAPWIPVMLLHSRIGAPFQDPTTLATFFDIVNKDFGHLLPMASRHGQVGIAFVVAALVCGFLAVRRMLRGTAGELPGPLFVLAFCTVAAACVEALLSLREPRYIFVFAPAAWVWFAAIALAIWRWVAGAVRWQKIAAGAVALVVVALFVPSERFARAEGPPISSGMRALAPRAIALRQRGRTLFLVAPDYLGPTFGYYVSRPTGAVVHGFARWDDPQIFDTAGYLALWTDPNVLADAERRIAAAMSGPDDRLCLMRDSILIDRAKMPYTKSFALFAWIRAHYDRLSTTEAPGRDEDVIMDVFVRRHP